MKLTRSLLLGATLVVGLGFLSIAGAAGMEGMPMPGKGKQGCMGMNQRDMQGMDMKDMDSQKCAATMKSTPPRHGTAASAAARHHEADATVKAVNAEKGLVTLAHGPVKSLGWPAMTMAFGVKDKTLLDKLAVGQKVHVEFERQKGAYIVSEVK